MIVEILQQTVVGFIKVLPILVVAIVVSQIVQSYIPKDKIKDIFKENKKNILKSSLIGIATPGPLLAFLPLLRTLKEKGMPISLVVAFITGQTLVGPMRLFLEVGYFGIKFFAYRVVISLIIAIIIGMCFKIFEKHIQFK